MTALVTALELEEIIILNTALNKGISKSLSGGLHNSKCINPSNGLGMTLVPAMVSALVFGDVLSDTPSASLSVGLSVGPIKCRP